MTLVSCPVCKADLVRRGVRVPQHSAGMVQCRGSGVPSEEELTTFLRGIYPPLARLIEVGVRHGIRAVQWRARK